MYNLKELYPVLQQSTYLNTAAHGLVSTTTVAFKASLNEEFLHTGSLFTDRRAAFINDTRAAVAQFIDADFKLMAMVPNFSFAFNTLLESVNRDKKFLLINNDYPSINAPVEARGYNCFYANLDQHLEENIYKACVAHRPDFLALSVIQYINGIKIDLDFLKELKVQFPNLIIIVDGTQFVGVEEFRFRESGIDILAASCYKWLNASGGNGFITFKEHIVDQIKPKFTNYNSNEDFTNEPGSFMGHFEPGHLDILSFSGLKKAIDFTQEYGMDNIEKQIKELSAAAMKELSSRHMLEESVAGRKIHSSIFNIKGTTALIEKLENNSIIYSQRGSGLRVSFSYYNTMDDLNRLLNVIDNG